MTDSPSRSLLKSLSYRLLGSFLTLFLALAITGSWPMASALTGLEFAAKLIGYYLHERAWEWVCWGREL